MQIGKKSGIRAGAGLSPDRDIRAWQATKRLIRRYIRCRRVTTIAQSRAQSHWSRIVAYAPGVIS
jgi:hypothetical protein